MIEAYMQSRKRTMADSTRALRAFTLDRWLTWLEVNAGTHKLGPEEMTGSMYEAWWSYCRTTCSEGTSNGRTLHIQAFHRWCLRHDEYAQWTPPLKPIDLKEPAKNPSVAPTWADMDAAVYAALEGGAPWYGHLFLTMRCTGLRAGQVMRLRWDDVDLSRKRLTVRGELGKTAQERSGRMVPLAPVLVEHMAGWGVRDGWLIDKSITTHGTRPTKLDDRSIHHGVPKAIWKRTDVDPRVYRQPCHCFRKGFISELARAGVLSEVRKYLVGHARGTHGDTYTDPAALWPECVKAVAMVPELMKESNVYKLTGES